MHTLMNIGAGVPIMAYILGTRTAPLWLVQVYVTFQALGATLVLDLHGMAHTSFRWWPLLVVYLDIALVLDLRPVSYIIVGFALTYLTFVQTAAVVDPGLIMTDPWHDDESHPLSACDCLKPPCAVPPGESYATLGCTTIIFLLDFYFTRSFATGMRAEQRAVAASVLVAECVAEKLASFDLEAAEVLLVGNGTGNGGGGGGGGDGAENLPPKLRSALLNILSNLQEYRPYLPDALFCELSRTRQAGSGYSRRESRIVPANGPPGSACIVFTDIVASTRLWACEPTGMSKAMRLHNAAIRAAIADVDGYEVKTIGDSFMVACETLADGLAFGFLVQKRLLDCPWPPALLLQPQCAPGGSGVWGGITVRVGAHEGPVSSEVNPVTGRTDYMGVTVATAARLESVSVPGGVAVFREGFDALPPTVRFGAAELNLGCVQLRGLDIRPDVVCLFPPELGNRACQRPEAAPAAALLQATPAVKSPDGGVSPSLHVPRHVAAATVASVEVACDDEWSRVTAHRWNTRISTIFSSAERCQGSVFTLLGRAVAVSWNVTSPCHAHAESGLACARLLGPAGNTSYAIGLCSGPVCVGSAGFGSQRFVNVAGESVGLCRRMAEVARLEHLWCLFACLLGGGAGVPNRSGMRAEVSSEWRSVEGTAYRAQLVWKLQPLETEEAGAMQKQLWHDVAVDVVENA